MKFALVLVVLGVLAAGIVGWANMAWDTPGPPAAAQTIVLIPPGSRTHAVAGLLEHQAW